MALTSVSVEELRSKIDAGETVDLIDVRTPAEFQQVHASIARNQPLDALEPKQIMGDRNGQSQKPLYVICKSGSRSAMACRKFLADGFENVITVEGGTAAWEAAGLPVERREIRVIAIDRQMRIVAGSLVLTGILLGFVNPLFFGLSAFVGAGLVFAGVTDYCPMMNTLARMPWNRGQACKPCT